MSWASISAISANTFQFHGASGDGEAGDCKFFAFRKLSRSQIVNASAFDTADVVVFLYVSIESPGHPGNIDYPDQAVITQYIQISIDRPHADVWQDLSKVAV